MSEFQNELSSVLGESHCRGLIDGTFLQYYKRNSGSSQRPVKMSRVKTGLL